MSAQKSRWAKTNGVPGIPQLFFGDDPGGASAQDVEARRQRAPVEVEHPLDL